MNASRQAARLDSYRVYARTRPLPLKPIPKTDVLDDLGDLDDLDDLDDDIQLFRVLDPPDESSAPAALPEKRHPVLDAGLMVVSASQMRRIEYELRNDECDTRTVFNSCRGLAKGSLEFENAYIAARIRSFAKHQRTSAEPLLGVQPNVDTQPQTPCNTTVKKKSSPPPHPMAVMHPGHLMSHLGIWVLALLGTQAWAAWRVSAFVNAHLEGDRIFYFATGIFLMLALDLAVWFSRRGRLHNAFFVPGGVLFLMALLPILALHVRGVLLAMQ